MKKGKKVLMLNYEFPPLGGGAGNATYCLLKEFSKPKYKDLEIRPINSACSRPLLQSQLKKELSLFQILNILLL